MCLVRQRNSGDELLLRQPVYPVFRQLIQEHQKRCIGPAEADHVLLISGVDA